MIHRLARNPAVLVLAGVALFSMFAVNWALNLQLDDQGFGWSGAPTEAQLWEQRLLRIAGHVSGPAALTAVVSVLGILIVGSATEGAGRPATRSTGDRFDTGSNALQPLKSEQSVR